MRHHAQRAESKREAIDDKKQDLEGDDAVDKSVEQFLREYGVLFHELGEVVETGSCKELALAFDLGVSRHENAVPIASVKNAKPRTTPTYPRSGRIHMFVELSSGVKLDDNAMRSDRWH